MRLVSCNLRSPLENQHISPNWILQQNLRYSGWSYVAPVIHGCSGAQPGQNRDKNNSDDWSNLSFVPWLPATSQTASARRRSGKKRFEPEENLDEKIDRLFALHNQLMPRSKARLIGMIYARFSTDFQHSISDQVRVCLERAVELGIHVPRECIFYDQAIRGCKDRRPGLNSVRGLLSNKVIQVLLIFTTNRLYRKSYKSMKFVEEEVYERGIRCIFVMSRIDTDEDDRWRLPLQVNSMVDELSVTMYADNIRAAHLGLFAQGYVVTALPYGYTGIEVEGRLTKRNLPRREIAIDPETSKFVKLIFQWFVHERLGVNEIIRKLNEIGAPLPTNCQVGYWHWRPLRDILTHDAYRASWNYGVGVNRWLNSKDYSKRILRPKPLATHIWEHLRLISDEDWFAAQKRLTEFARLHAGRKTKDPDRPKRSRVINGFLICKDHDRPLRANGSEGQWVNCSHCQALPRGQRPIHSYLPRELAIRTICHELARHMRPDEMLFDAAISYCRQVIESAQRGDLQEPDEIRARMAKIDRQIQFLMENQGESDEDRAESATKLRELRHGRTQLRARLATLEAALNRPVKMPTRDEIEAWFRCIELVLVDAAECDEPQDADLVRSVIQKLTGGRIEMEQMGERRRQRGWLRGRFRLRILNAVSQDLLGHPADNANLGPEITIDFKSETIAEEKAAEARRLYDLGELIEVIAEKLDIERHQVTDAVRISYERDGLPPPEDGRIRRAKVRVKNRRPFLFQLKSEEVKALYDQGLLLEDIAERLQMDRTTVRQSLNYWFESRGLKCPDGRSRRWQCDQPRRWKHTPGRRRDDQAPPENAA